MFAFDGTAGVCAVYRRAGLALLLCSFWIFTQSLPPFQSGIWLQVEPVVAALWLCGGALALWCAFGVATGRLRLLPASWPEALLAGWVLWQLLAGVYAGNGMRSWFGPPEQGEGAAWHVALAVMVFAFVPFWQSPRYRRRLLVSAVSAIGVQCVLYLLCPLSELGRYVPGSWRPSTWAAYIAFMAGYMWIAWGLAQPLRLRALLAAAAVLVPVLWVSGNKSSMLLLGLAVVVTLAGRRWLAPARVWQRLAMAACVAPLLWVAFSVAFPRIEPYSNRFIPMLSEKEGSLGSRIMLNRMAVQAMRHEPGRWLVGAGWGAFPDITYRYVLLPDVHVFKDGLRRPNSLMVDGYSFHSHDQPLEALLALGLPGVLLWLALPLALLAAIPAAGFWAAAPMLVGLVWEANVWFELAQCVPYRALALAAVIAGAGRSLPRLRARPVAAVLAAAAAALLYSAHFQYGAMEYAMRLRHAAHALPAGDYAQEWVESDLRIGGDRLRSSAEFFVQWLMLKQKGLGLDENDRAWFGRFIGAAHAAGQSPGTGAMLATLEPRLSFVALKDISDPVFMPMHALIADNLPAVLLQAALRVPERDDVAAPYLHQLEHAPGMPVEKRLEFVDKLLSVAPAHRGGRWVKGALLRQLPGRQEQGIALQRQALAAGAERVYPLPPLEGLPP